MTRARPQRAAALLLALVVVAPPGCVTRALWDTWPSPPRPQAPAAPPTGVPVRLEQAVRTGEGAFHVLAAYSDGSTRHLAVRPFAGPEADAWPDAIRRSDIVAEVEGALAGGAPLRIAGQASCAATDDDAPAPDAAEPVDVISLERDALRVVNAAGESWTLATFAPTPPTPETPPGRPVEDDPARVRVIVVFFTPFALVIDAAIAVLVFGPMLPVVAKDLLKLLD